FAARQQQVCDPLELFSRGQVQLRRAALSSGQSQAVVSRDDRLIERTTRDLCARVRGGEQRAIALKRGAQTAGDVNVARDVDQTLILADGVRVDKTLRARLARSQTNQWRGVDVGVWAGHVRQERNLRLPHVFGRDAFVQLRLRVIGCRHAGQTERFVER